MSREKRLGEEREGENQGEKGGNDEEKGKEKEKRMRSEIPNGLLVVEEEEG